jgi:hypothetical protein
LKGRDTGGWNIEDKLYKFVVVEMKSASSVALDVSRYGMDW